MEPVCLQAGVQPDYSRKVAKGISTSAAVDRKTLRRCSGAIRRRLTGFQNIQSHYGLGVSSVEPDAADERQLQRQIARIQAERQAKNVHLEPFLGGSEQPEYTEDARL